MVEFEVKSQELQQADSIRPEAQESEASALRQEWVIKWAAVKAAISRGQLNTARWRDHWAYKFRELGEEQSQMFLNGTIHGHGLYAHGCYGNNWQLIGDRSLKARFLSLAAGAGRELRGAPDAEKASDFWLHCLYLHLEEHGGSGQQPILGGGPECGTLKEAIESSEEFCNRISAQEIDDCSSGTLFQRAMALQPRLEPGRLVAEDVEWKKSPNWDPELTKIIDDYKTEFRKQKGLTLTLVQIREASKVQKSTLSKLLNGKQPKFLQSGSPSTPYQNLVRICLHERPHLDPS